jgi:hypothetical protein
MGSGAAWRGKTSAQGRHSRARRARIRGHMNRRSWAAGISSGLLLPGLLLLALSLWAATSSLAATRVPTLYGGPSACPAVLADQPDQNEGPKKKPKPAPKSDSAKEKASSKKGKKAEPKAADPQAAESGKKADSKGAEPKKSVPKKSSKISFVGSAGFQAIYDDNILRASDSTILEFRQGNVPWKFKIDTYDDLILSPKIGLTFGRKLIGSKETTLRFGYVRYQYLSNPIKNNESFNFRLRQPTIGRDFIEFSYGWSPYAYIRELSDRAPTDPATSPLLWMAFKSTRNGFVLGYSRKMSNRLNLRLDGGRVIRYYNQRFMENDNWEWNWTGSASYSLTGAFKLNGQYQYSSVKARAVDMIGETIALTNDGDPSYARDLYEGAVAWGADGKLWKIDQIQLLGQYQAYFYTSKLPYWEDSFHVGRKDQVYTVELTTATIPIIGAASLEAGYRFSKRTSSATENVDIADEKDYTDNRMWVGVNTSF